MNRKQLAFLGLSFLAIGAVSNIAVAQDFIPEGDNFKEELSVPKLNSTPRTYIYPDNSQADTSKFDTNKQKLENRKLKTGLKYKSIRLMKYSEYIEERNKSNLGVIENLQVHPNRLVFLVEIHAPNGLELPNKNPLKSGGVSVVNGQRVAVGGQQLAEEPRTTKLKKAKILHAFDAETGDIFGGDIIGVNEL